MKKLTEPELAEVLRLHKMWLDGETGRVRGNLSYANLTDTTCF